MHDDWAARVTDERPRHAVAAGSKAATEAMPSRSPEARTTLRVAALLAGVIELSREALHEDGRGRPEVESDRPEPMAELGRDDACATCRWSDVGEMGVAKGAAELAPATRLLLARENITLLLPPRLIPLVGLDRLTVEA
jgi:hypothetical protein